MREQNRQWHKRERERLIAARPRKTCAICSRSYQPDGRQDPESPVCSKACGREHDKRLVARARAERRAVEAADRLALARLAIERTQRPREE